jgi:Zn-dependent peptidase ImmA (M78 family)
LTTRAAAGMLGAMPHPSPADQATVHSSRAADNLAGLGAGEVTTATLLRVCQDRGVAVREADLLDLRGALSQATNQWVITINRGDSPERRRFTLARALGHFVLHARPGRTFVLGGLETSPMRAAADEVRAAAAFALALLVPTPVVRRHLPHRHPTEREVHALAARCGVSPLAAAFRLRELGYRLPPT